MDPLSSHDTSIIYKSKYGRAGLIIYYKAKLAEIGVY